jgi:hypothetical protein
MWWPFLTSASIIISIFSLRARGFIPAQAINVTQGSSWDVHDNSTLSLTWYPNGSYSTVISYQLSGNGSMGVSKVCNPSRADDQWLLLNTVRDCRVLSFEYRRTISSITIRVSFGFWQNCTAHFYPATTPWIAFINCDKNATDMSMEVDIFTMVRDRGAKAAVSPPDKLLGKP